MRLLIFGATGTIGRQLVDQTLENGHQVTAFVRMPSKLSVENPALTVLQGDVLDFESVQRAMPGHDAVLIALGAGAMGRIRTEGTENIVRAMRKHRIRRLICLSSLGVGDSRGNLNFFWKYVMFGLLLRRAYADHVGQEQTVRESGLDWTIVRPAAYTDGGITKQYRHGFSPTTQKLELKVSRADVAHFMLRQLETNDYLLKTPGVSY